MRSRNSSAVGFEIIGGESFLLKHTERYIAYDVKESGFHFILDKNVMHAIEKVAPVLQNFSQQSHGKPIDQLDFHVFHTGGRKILDDLATHLPLPEYALRHSRRSLKECGNISSAVVFDVLERFFREKEQVSGNKGILAAFGPGFTAEMSAGVWRN
jgi:type III polyketide synthase